MGKKPPERAAGALLWGSATDGILREVLEQDLAPKAELLGVCSSWATQRGGCVESKDWAVVVVGGG